MPDDDPEHVVDRDTPRTITRIEHDRAPRSRSARRAAAAPTRLPQLASSPGRAGRGLRAAASHRAARDRRSPGAAGGGAWGPVGGAGGGGAWGPREPGSAGRRERGSAGLPPGAAAAARRSWAPTTAGPAGPRQAAAAAPPGPCGRSASLVVVVSLLPARSRGSLARRAPGLLIPPSAAPYRPGPSRRLGEHLLLAAQEHAGGQRGGGQQGGHRQGDLHAQDALLGPVHVVQLQQQRGLVQRQAHAGAERQRHPALDASRCGSRWPRRRRRTPARCRARSGGCGACRP